MNFGLGRQLAGGATPAACVAELGSL